MTSQKEGELTSVPIRGQSFLFYPPQHHPEKNRLLTCAFMVVSFVYMQNQLLSTKISLRHIANNQNNDIQGELATRKVQRTPLLVTYSFQASSTHY